MPARVQTFDENFLTPALCWHEKQMLAGFGIDLAFIVTPYVTMMLTAKNIKPGEKSWEEPANPAVASDARDKEQIERQFNEARRRKDNLTETDHIDKEKKTEN